MPKRSLAISFVLLLFFCCRTQAQVTIGVEAGPDFARILNILQGNTGSGSFVTKNSQSTTHFYGGFLANIPLDKKSHFIFRPSLLYLGAGGETPLIKDFNGNVVAMQTNYNLDYFQLPLQLLYSPSLPIGRPWIGGGVYGGALISGTTKTQAGLDYLRIGNGPNDELKRFDVGYNASAGFTFQCGILIGVDYQQGLTGIVPNPSSGAPKVENSVWGVHIGYVSSIGRGPRRAP